MWAGGGFPPVRWGSYICGEREEKAEREKPPFLFFGGGVNDVIVLCDAEREDKCLWSLTRFLRAIKTKLGKVSISAGQC